MGSRIKAWAAEKWETGVNWPAESYPASNTSARDISCFSYYYSDEPQLGLVVQGISSAIF